jgi:hypothetical protein
VDRDHQGLHVGRKEVDRVAIDSGPTGRQQRRHPYSSAFVPLIRMAISPGSTSRRGRATLDGTLALGVFSVLVYMTSASCGR